MLNKSEIDNTISVIKEENCFGCSACLNRCPVDAITMVENSEGFLFPQIAQGKCVKCGKCLKACPAANTSYINSADPECYAVMAENNIRLQSSSGGVFTLLANFVLEKDGYVCGAAFSDDYSSVDHIVISDYEGLEKLRGSKYVQSDIRMAYRKIEEILVNGDVVLFTGCPCQVAGLYTYLQKDYSNLYTVDLVCHGVPAPKAYRKFLQEREAEQGSVKKVAFRDKSHYGWNVSTTIEFQNGEIDYQSRSQSSWMRSFLNLLTLRKSCGNCPYAKIPRQGDMTIADFWDIDKYKKELDDGKGTSLVLVNNKKGKILLEELKQRGKVCEPAPLEHAKKYNAQLYSSSRLHPRRERFFRLLDLYDFDKAVDYGMNRRFDIGYVGWWYGKNYGSALTSFALHETMVSMGKTVLMLDWPEHVKPVGPPPQSNVRKFAQKHYDISMRYTYEELHKLNYHCDSFVVGSDQLWNYYSVEENGFYFFLDFVEAHKRKIAYATSFGHEKSFFPQEQNFAISQLLNQFTAISVREKEGIDICHNSFGVEAVQTLDPVFLCDIEIYNKVISEVKLESTEKYLLAYILDPNKEKAEALLFASKRLGLSLKIILDGQGNFEENSKKMGVHGILNNVGIEEWLYYFKNASYIITDSYHGLCFSILFNKQFVCIGNKLRGMSRFQTLLSNLDLEERLIKEIDKEVINNLISTPISYAEPNKLLQKEKEHSYAWLQCALNGPNIKQPSIESLLAKEITELKQKVEELRVNDREINQKQVHFATLSCVNHIKQGIYYCKKNGVKNTIKRVLKH